MAGKDNFRDRFRPFITWVLAHVPRGLRLLLGILMIIGGVFGFLPVLGFWMIPLGVLVAAMDIKLVCRWLRRRRR